MPFPICEDNNVAPLSQGDDVLLIGKPTSQATGALACE